ncbi:hypothetical protein ACQPU1_09775 [Clostridium paraputrificum]|uniref:hypothetical protein n=1 Tax=Clostridium TaxID=1485 RepID=UPI003D332481
MIAIAVLQEKLIVGNDFDIWVVVTPYYYLIFLIGIIIIFFLRLIYEKIYKSNNGEHILDIMIYNLIKKYKILFSTAILIVLYLIIVNIVSIEDEKIAIHSTFNPLGKEYSLQDIVQVETGFTGKKTLINWKERGTFYYKIKLKDGKEFDLNGSGGESEVYGEHTYLSIEEIDKRLFKDNSNIIKKSSLDNYEYAGLDDEYMERFKRIIKNVNE